ncbi:hypothetical protein CASFOL_008057 [Castilleja foliolosa]|uniref:Formin-like protein n=1 Tax=Castilleja foliolosa TaxID=1961234 RepID=A0ABD3E1V0_9LAMI
MKSNLYNLQDEDSKNKGTCLLFSGFCSAAFHCGGNRCGEQMGGTRSFTGLSNRFRGDQSGDDAELLQLNCMPELSQVQNTLQNLELHLTDEKSSASTLPRLNRHDTVNILLPEVNQILIDCVREKNLLQRDSGEDKNSNTWYNRFFEFLFNRRSLSARRSLAETPLEAPAPAPADSSPVEAPAPAPAASSPSPAPSFIPHAPPEVPAHPPVVPFMPPKLNDPVSRNNNTTDINSSGLTNSSSQRTVVIAVVVTAFVTLVMAALIFCCWRRFCGPGWRRGRKDDRPLLSLSLSGHSVSSSQNLGDNNNNNQSFNNNKANHGKISGKFFMESHSLSLSKFEATAYSEENYPQTSPDTPSSPGTPPLKPPPGRTEPPKPPPITAAPTVPPRPPRGPPTPPHGPPPPPPPGPRPPPPPPGGGIPPPRPPPIGFKPPPPLHSGPPLTSAPIEEEGGSSKAKLKPFFWDKVLANPDHSMVWHQIRSGSFQFSEEMIESLFSYAPASDGKNKNEAKKESSSQDVTPQYIQIIDAKKSQNLAILLKALNVTTEEVCDALEEGNELPSELIQTLIKMAPTAEEELKLRQYSGELSQLGPAERFLKILVDIPFAFKRLESLLFMCTLQEETTTLKESYAVLEAACTELRKSRLFLKLLEAVLKTGNRMNDGTFRGGAQAFKLDTLLKLSDVKGTNGKTTLLHFVVQEIIRSEGIRTARAAKESRSSSSFKSDDPLEDIDHDSDDHLRNLGLDVVSGLGNELENVKKAAAMDADNLTGTLSKLGQAIVKAQGFLNSDMKNIPEENGFRRTLKSFVQNAEVDVRWAREEEKRIMAMVKSTVDYFHGNSGKDEGLRLFAVVRDFLIILDKVCREVKNMPHKFRMAKKDDMVAAKSDPRQPAPAPAPVDPRQRLFPAITDRRVDSSSSDDES